jgi:hypothetical protein
MASKVARILEKKIVANNYNTYHIKIEKICERVSKNIILYSDNQEIAKKVASGLIKNVLKDVNANVTSKTIISKIAQKIITKIGNNPPKIEIKTQINQSEYRN